MTYTPIGYIIILEYGGRKLKNEKCSECLDCAKFTHRSEIEKKKIIKRLNIIEGQVRGIKQMIENDRYCDDVLTQMSAINNSIESLENSILESHIKSCVSNQIKAGNLEIIDEVMELFKRLR